MNESGDGCDGIKMIEGKRTTRRQMGVTLTDPYYRDFWHRVEEIGLPVICHVGDPEEFWDPARIPQWAARRRWGYGPDDAQNEQFYGEIDAVLETHPRLKIVLAHFYFLSADLPRAERFLDAHPAASFDLAPGIEMLYNISRDPDTGRKFFLQYAGRIVYGTDMTSYLTATEARARAGLVFRWLESDDTFRVPAGADDLLGPPADGIIRGMTLPADALRRIYHDNFAGMAGAHPRPLRIGNAVEICERFATVAEAMSGRPRAQTEAGQVVAELKKRPR